MGNNQQLASEFLVVFA